MDLFRAHDIGLPQIPGFNESHRRSDRTKARPSAEAGGLQGIRRRGQVQPPGSPWRADPTADSIANIANIQKTTGRLAKAPCLRTIAGLLNVANLGNVGNGLIRLHHAGPHHRLGHPPPAQDHQLHAGHDGVSDALLPGRSLLGRPARQGGRRRGRRRRQPHVHRAGALADARRRHDRRWSRMRRAGRTTIARCCCSTSRRCCRWCRACVLRRDDGAPAALRADARRRCRRPRPLAAEYLLWFIPAMALQFAMVAMGAALRGHRQLQAGHDRADRDGHPQHAARADPDLRLVHGAPRWAWPARRSRRSSRSWSASSGSAPTSCRPPVSPFPPGGLAAAASGLAEHAEDRAAGRRRVRADGGLPGHRLHVAGRSARRRRRRSASGCA